MATQKKEFPYEEEYSATSVGSHSLEEENCNTEKKYEDLKRQLEKMESENKELACQLKKEEESLQCSQLQLEEKIAKCNGLTRQLESALEEGRKMAAEELEKMSCRERAIRTKMLALEAEVKEGQEKIKRLLCAFHHNKKHHEVQLKELENSLQKSENKRQSMQKYVQFLRASYIIMFG